jgi:hypothetical protein
MLPKTRATAFALPLGVEDFVLYERKFTTLWMRSASDYMSIAACCPNACLCGENVGLADEIDYN